MYKNTLMLVFFIFLSSIFLISACHQKPIIPASPAISYSNEVQPIVLGNCATPGCHNSNSHLRALTNYNEVMIYIKAGNASKSQLYKAITSLSSNEMPPSHPLSEEQIKLIYVWIMQGAKNN
jgi:hypothetical protein